MLDDQVLDGTQVDGQSSGDSTVTATVDGSDAAAGGYEIDGEKFTDEEIRSAVDALRNRDAWESAYKQRDQRFAAVRGAVEAGFGKRLTDLTEDEVRDLQAMGLINTRLRSDPNFARAWEESLFEAYKKAGLSSGQAAQAARQDVREAQKTSASLSPEVEARLKKVDDLESLYVEQGLTQFQNMLEGELGSIIAKHAGDLAKNFGPTVRMMILQGIQGYSDVELLEMWQGGQLQREMATLARDSVKTLRGHLSAGDVDKARALQRAKEGTAPAPLKGGVAEQSDVVEPRLGAGLSYMTDRLRKSMAAARQ